MHLKKRIVVVGGGTGTYTVLKGLRQYTNEFDISAIVTMADSGGSTGRLRDEFGQLPVGDVRMALVALAEHESNQSELLRQLFLYRFDKGAGLSGHNFGNLLLTALTDILGSSSEAITAAAQLLGVGGSVIPVTTDNVHLQAVYSNGEMIVGEHAIDTPPAHLHHERIVQLSVTPEARINPLAATALEEADIIVFGPGDLYTSILANCVVQGFTSSLARSKATIVYISNLMSRPGQTNGMATEDHIAELIRYNGRAPHHILVNSTELPAHIVERYQLQGTHPINTRGLSSDYAIHSNDLLATESVVTHTGDVLSRSLIRHDSAKIAATLRQILGVPMR